LKIGGRVLYRIEDIEEFEKRQVKAPISGFSIGDSGEDRS
jgi:hypothetical protein